MTDSQVLMGPLFLLYGLLFGAIFGFLLQRGHILRFEKQLGLLRLKDMTVLKYMLSAALSGMIGTSLLRSLDFIEIGARPVYLGPFIIGGLVFGIGWAIVGYCPGTQLGALGEGRYDAGWAVLGAWAGALAYEPLYPLLIGLFFGAGRLHAYNFDVVFGVDPWIVTAACAAVFIPLCVWFERRGL
jgi:hypothetical protein